MLHLVVVNATGFLVQVVAYRFVKNAGGVDQGTVAQMPTMVKVQTHKGVARLQYGQQYGCVGLGTGVGLDVGVFCAKQLADTVNSQLFNLVNDLTAAVVAVARIAFRILVGKVAAHGFHDLVANKVLTGDELDAFQLALVLLLNQLKNLIVSFHCFYLFLVGCSVFVLQK